jgi:hypothetical protein
MARPSAQGGKAIAINYTVSNDWGSGFTGSMTLPGGSQGLQGWTLAFDAGFDITNVWKTVIVSHVGNHYVIQNAPWNGNVAAGGRSTGDERHLPIRARHASLSRASNAVRGTRIAVWQHPGSHPHRCEQYS